MNNYFLQYLNNIRANMRCIRKSLTIAQQQHASRRISNIAFNFSFILNCKNIAIFMPFDGEINTYHLLKKLWLNKKQVFLPVIHSVNNKKLLFVKFTSNSILYYNKYKILEPFLKYDDVVSIDALDVVITPLVAFDRKGTRLGMGGGFYDTYLKNWKKFNVIPIGLAYNFQFVYNIPKNHWDISLPYVLTPNKIYFFKNYID